MGEEKKRGSDALMRDRRSDRGRVQSKGGEKERRRRGKKDEQEIRR
jgi:hypothetical protein